MRYSIVFASSLASRITERAKAIGMPTPELEPLTPLDDPEHEDHSHGRRARALELQGLKPSRALDTKPVRGPRAITTAWLPTSATPSASSFSAVAPEVVAALRESRSRKARFTAASAAVAAGGLDSASEPAAVRAHSVASSAASSAPPSPRTVSVMAMLKDADQMLATHSPRGQREFKDNWGKSVSLLKPTQSEP